MVLFPDRIRQPVPVAATWLATLRADARMTGLDDALALAGALAPFVQDAGNCELPSATDLARLSKLTEDGAIDAVNQLIYRGFVALMFRPKITFSTPFFVRPSPYAASMIEKEGG